MTQQLEIDFERDFNDLLRAIADLRLLPLDITNGRLDGVCEFLTRLLILSKRTGLASIRQPLANIASGITGRPPKSDRTVRNWANDAKRLGLLEVIVMSQEYGGTHWNQWIVNWSRLREMTRSGFGHCEAANSDRRVAGNGRKWPEMVSGRPETVSAPGPEMVSAPILASKPSSNAVCLSDDGPDPHQRASERAQTSNLVTASPVRVDPDDANRIVELLQAQGWDDGARRKADQWLAQGKTVGEIEFQCRVFAAWRSAFDGPGAIATKIEHRYWPNRKGARFRAPQWPDDGPMLAEREAVVAAESEAARARAMEHARRMARPPASPAITSTASPNPPLAWDSLSPAEQAARIAAVKNQNRLLARLPDNSPLILDAVRHVPDG